MRQPASAVVAGKRLGPSMAAVGGGSSSSGVRSESDKEKTKIRERQRRAITTKIFHGLRKNGGYRLSPRADLNEVLRELAKEAGWIIESDGTTYRSKILSSCSICGTVKASGGQTPTSSMINGGGGGVAGGACSTTASPHRFTGGSTPLYFSCGVSGDGVSSEGPSSIDREILSDPLAVYMYDRFDGNGVQLSSSMAGIGGAGSAAAVLAYQQQHEQMYLQEARASNQNTPVGSPSRRV